MPKLIRKPKPSATESGNETNTTNNNNENNGGKGCHDNEEHVNAKYEDLNPRYVKDSKILLTEREGEAHEEASQANDVTLMEKIRGRIGTYIEEPWTIIGSYFEGKHLEQLVRHQIESYNDMINVQLKRTVDMFNPVKIASDQDYDKTTHKYRLEVEVNFTNLCLSRPQIHENTGATKILFPQEARLRNFTYASMMTVDMNVKYIVRGSSSSVVEGVANDQPVGVHHKVFPKIQIGKMPIMLKSCICVLKQHDHLDHNITGECPYDAGGYFIINGSEKTVLGQERAAENKVLCYNVAKNNNKWRYVAEIKRNIMVSDILLSFRFQE
jgi:DNA-directed RNA polymerase beta subunit